MFNKIARTKSEENVFTDYLDMVICAISAGKYEEEYLSIVKRYKKEEVNLFCELMAEMLIVMDNQGAGLADCLGEFYQQYISNSRLQQFFTPQHISDFMAQIIMDEDTTAGRIIADPCCGSGRMLLSVDESEEQKAKDLLQDIIRAIKPIQVINPYAHKITIPVDDDSKARVNQIFQNLVMQVCLMHQYQRNQDLDNRLIAEIEDMRIATELLFDALSLDKDEPDSATLNFYQQVKAYIEKTANGNKEDYVFTMQELRSGLGCSGSGAFRFVSRLYKLHYIEREGYANRGFKYKIAWWGDTDKRRKEIKNNILSQLELLGMPGEKQGAGKPRTKPAKGLGAGAPAFENNTYALNEPTHAYGLKSKNVGNSDNRGTKTDASKQE